ncbi:MAG: substrate-binding domain-containing protein, partial [Bacteroidota bacterium]|nr:substrate-binding domain-containing protein [Bacteroidota bacterium]
MKSNKFLFPALILFFVACSNAPKPGALDTPISGKIPLSIDENVRSLSDELIDAFESSYPEAFLMQSYNSETNVLKELYDDSSRLAIMMRPLKPEEVKWFEA